MMLNISCTYLLLHLFDKVVKSFAFFFFKKNVFCIIGLFESIISLILFYSLDISFLDFQMWFPNIFTQFVAYLFTLLMSFKDPKFLILIKYNSLFFSFHELFLTSYLRNPCLTQGHKDFLLCFLPKIFTLLGVTISIYDLFWANFYRWGRIWMKVPVLLHTDIQSFQHQFWKTITSPLNCLSNFFEN